jgi:DNA-binding transcriptional LysR family regulator
VELHQVRYFLALCREQTFTRAAQACGVSQPSLTNAIKRLEQELGGELFYRGPTKTVLSEIGHAVFPHLERMTACMAEAHRAAERFRSPPTETANGGFYAQTTTPRYRSRALNGGGDTPDKVTHVTGSSRTAAAAPDDLY